MSRQKTRRVDKRKLPQRKPTPVWLMILVAVAGLAVLYLSPEALRSKSQTPASTVSAPATSNGASPQARNTSSATPPVADSLIVFPTNFNTLTDTEKAAFYQNLGSQLLQKQRYGDAIAQYRTAVKLNPEDEDTHYNLALALAKGGDQEGAKKEYLEALRIYPDYPEAHNNLGNLLLAEGKLEDAVTHFKAAL